MALKVLMLRKKIDDKKKELETLREGSAFETREAELEQAIEEAETEEEKQAVEDGIASFEEEKQEYEKKAAALEEEINGLEGELAELESRQERAVRAMKEGQEKRKEGKEMETRRFFGMNSQERDMFFQREDVREFLGRVRSLGKENRAVSGAELLIPTVVLDLIRENIEEYSKLYKHVNVRPVPGKARQNVMGVVPEGVWTEMCGKLNELMISFSGVEVDGYKVGGYIAVCNALLDDSDISLAAEIIRTLGQAIGLALDKAVLYGTGKKMPLGIVTRLTQTEDPEAAGNSIPWKDLHSTNVLAITGKTDIALFKELITATGAAKGRYSRGVKFWAMNETTFTKLVANALSINASGAIVSGMNKQMPVIGGEIETLEFIPNDVIIGGYGDLYLLAERAGTSIAQSEHARFIEDQTVFKGTARYDGLPVIAEGFVAIGINGTAPTASAVTFAADTANAAGGGTAGGDGETTS